MSDKEDKSFNSVKSKLNAKLQGSGTEFTDIKEVEPGKFELTAVMSQEQINQRFGFEKVDYKKLVCERKIQSGSVLEKVKLNEEYEQLIQKLDIAHAKDQKNNPNREVARLDIKYRDQLKNSYLDLRDKPAEEVEAIKLYARSDQEYYRTGIYGTTLDLLSDFSAAGFYNEINNLEVKEYFDSWVKDSNFINTVKKIFHNLYKYNVCYVMPAYGPYEPNMDGISSIPGKEPNKSSRTGLKASVAYFLNEMVRKETGSDMDFEKFSHLYSSTEMGAKTGQMPIAYTLLDPKNITIMPSGFFNKSGIIYRKAGYKQIKAFLKAIDDDAKINKSSKDVIKFLPSGLKKAIEDNQDYYFQDGEIHVLNLRKEDFEGYAKPKGSRAFDSFDYKDELKKADFATVDGIYNYILKVTVGDKDNPVTDPTVLENLAEAFNTPQKAFTVVWNHTLDIEKITSGEVGAILGKEKYEPVESDITAALGMARALIDGANITGDAANLTVKAVQSQLRSAREVVEFWVYGEYKTIAKASGFTTYPFIRWKEGVISTDSDAVMRSSMLGMLDRKAVSIQTFMREMNLDYETEVQRMTDEFSLIEKGILQAGSPFQASAAPDAGRPAGQPAVTKKPVDQTKVVKRQTKVPSATNAMSEEDSLFVQEMVASIKNLDPILQENLVGSLIRKEVAEEEESLTEIDFVEATLGTTLEAPLTIKDLLESD